MWNDGMSREKVLEHYGYKDTKEAHVAMGFWPKKSVPEKIRHLSEGLLSALDFKKKVRVIFEYDPDFPRAFLKIEGTKDTSVITEENVDYEIENWETTETDSESLSDIEKKILWYIEQDPEKKVIQIRPANDNCILLHGAQEAKYFIEILKESIQQMF